MVSVGGEGNASHDSAGQGCAFAHGVITEKAEANDLSASGQRTNVRNPVAAPRRTPRVSLVVVLPENHSISPERLARSLGAHGNEQMDVVVACAGQPTNLSALQRTIGAAQFLLAPAGTSTEDLRALAMRQAPGDIVTLLSGALLPEGGGQPEQLLTS
jgi:hypothetical protein